MWALIKCALLQIWHFFSVSVLSLSHIFRQKFRRRKWLEVPFGNRSRSSGATHFFPFFFWRLLALKVVSHLYPSSSKFFERGKIWMTMLEWASPWSACQIQPSFVYLIVSSEDGANALGFSTQSFSSFSIWWQRQLGQKLKPWINLGVATDALARRRWNECDEKFHSKHSRFVVQKVGVDAWKQAAPLLLFHPSLILAKK